MGMDLYGKNPKSEAGKYFRANIWSWGNIMTLIQDAPVLQSYDLSAWYQNAGAGLDESEQDTLDSLADYVEKIVESSPQSGDEILIRRELTPIEMAVEMAVENIVVEAIDGIMNKAASQTNNNSERGSDDAEANWTVDTPFRPEQFRGSSKMRESTLPKDYLLEFAAFLRDCGGFEIW